jgi:type II secretory pathway component PulJ
MTKHTHKLKRQCFSLAELIVAMSLLILLMGLLFKFILQAQRLWQVDESNARIYQNSRTIFNIIGRDLQGMVTSDELGRKIYCTNNPPGLDAAWITASAIGAKDSDFAKLIEVGYSFTGNKIERYMTSSGPVAAPEGKWNFMDAAPATWAAAASWESSTELAEGVESFEIKFYNDSMTPMAAGDFDKKPAMVLIEIELFDPAAILIMAEKARTMRSISKMIFLRVQE